MALQQKVATILTCLLLAHMQFLADGKRTKKRSDSGLSQATNALQATAKGDAGATKDKKVANDSAATEDKEVADDEKALRKGPQVEAERKQQELEVLVKEARRNLEVYAERVEGMLPLKPYEPYEQPSQVQDAMKEVQDVKTWLNLQARSWNIDREQAAEEYVVKREELKKVTKPIVPLAEFSAEDLIAMIHEVQVMETEVAKVESAEGATQQVSAEGGRFRNMFPSGKGITKAVILLLAFKALPGAVVVGESISNQVAQMTAKYGATTQHTPTMMQDLQRLESEIKTTVGSPNLADDNLKGPGFFAKMFDASSHTPEEYAGVAAEHQQPDDFQALYAALDVSMHSQVEWNTGERHEIAGLLADKGITASDWKKALYESRQGTYSKSGVPLQSGRYDHSSKFYRELAQDLANGVDVGAVGTGMGAVNANYLNLYEVGGGQLSNGVRRDLAREMASKGVEMSKVKEAIAASKRGTFVKSPLYQHTPRFIERLVRDVIAGKGFRYNL